MASRARLSMRMLLLLLVAVTALPQTVLLGYQVVRESQRAVDTARHVVQDIATDAARETEASLNDLERTLNFLAKRPQVLALDPARCDTLFNELPVMAAKATLVASFDAHGNTVCSSSPPSESDAINVAGDAWFRAVMDSGSLVVGVPQRGPITQRWVSFMAVPVRATSGAIAGVLGIAIDLVNFRPIRAASLPPGGALAIVARDGLIVSRHPDAQQWVGRTSSTSAAGSASARTRIPQVLAGTDGVERVYAWEPVAQREWVVAAGLPTSQIFMPLRQSLWRNGLGFLLAFAVIALLALAVYRRISRPLLDLRAAAQAIAGGDLSRRAAVEGPSEFTDVARSFNHMLERLLHVEGALREREDHYRRLFLASPQAICVVGDGRVLVANPSAVNLFGSGVESATIGHEFLDFVHPDDRARTSLRLQSVLGFAKIGLPAAGKQDPTEAPKTEVKIICTNGNVVTVELDMLPFAIEARPAVMTLATDVSRQRQLEDEVQAHRDEVEQLVNRQVAVHTTLAIAHEINQPLGAVSAYCEAALFMLSNGNQSPVQLRLALEKGVQQAHRAGSSLHELVEFLQQEEAPAEPFDLAATIRQALALVRTERYKFDLKLDLPTRLPPVRGRRSQVLKAIVNLLHNAVEATTSTGAADARITIAASVVDEMVRVSIHDAGPGLTDDAARRLFTPFFTTKAGGMGLGLVITRALVEAQGGQLWQDAPAGTPGAAFHFTIPFAT